MSRSDTRSNILSNINQNQGNVFKKKKTGRLNFNDNGIAIICKLESSQEIIPIFFGIKYNNNEDYDIFEQQTIILKIPFVLFKPINSFNIYKNKSFIFYYSPVVFISYNENLYKINYTEDEWKSMSV